MILKLAFRYFSEGKKIEYLRDQGILLGSRVRLGRRIYLYMLRDFFVEVIYMSDDMDLGPETVMMFGNLQALNTYLQKDFQTI